MQAARRLGVDVTVGSEEPSTMSHLNPTGLLTLDLNDLARAAAETVIFAAAHPLSAVVAVDDQVAAAGAAIATALRLPSNPVNAIRAARNKYLMRRALNDAGVKQPRFQRCSLEDNLTKLSRSLNYPCVIKPLELAGSQGVIRTDGPADFIRDVTRLGGIIRNAATKNSHCTPGELPTRMDRQLVDHHFLVEEFVPGPEVAVEGILTNGRLRVMAIFDKPDPLDGPFFEETIYVTPSRHPDQVQALIAELTTQACQALHLVHGPVHAELRLGTDQLLETETDWTASDRSNVAQPIPRVIEVNPRSIGGLCSRVLRFGTGLSLEDLIIRHSLDPHFELPNREVRGAGVMMIPTPRGGVLREVRGVDAAKRVANIEDVVITTRVGQAVVPLPEGSLYLGFVFARAETPQAAEEALRTAHERLEFLIE